MFAVVKTGGKQYKVASGDVIKVEKLEAEAGATVELDQVLMVGGDGNVTVGAPMVAGAKVAFEVLEQTKGPKVIIFKKRRRKNSRRTRGHRQQITVLRVTGITAGA
ncbi:MAG: 50S ribosomal protein L21 [Thalassobaculum sp.]|uniref:50S ribosomal protein L21 n=1 Tax=Thalassobaculum sp. TaxID=2022740 RepID=UPI0032EC783E